MKVDVIILFYLLWGEIDKDFLKIEIYVLRLVFVRVIL